MTYNSRNYIRSLLLGSTIVAGLAWASTANAGPVILGGDDLTDHGFRSGGANLTGWLYIEKAIDDLFTRQTRAADTGMATTFDIAAIGSADPGAGVFPAGNAGGAINSVGDVLGLSVSFFDGASAISQFFTDLGTGVVNPAIIWLAGDGADNDLTTSEKTELDTRGSDLDTFVGNGGGLMSHGDEDTYGWLTALLPAVTLNSSCDSDGASLTADGQAAFPGLSDADVAAGPCHNTFGNIGGNLTVLANDGQGRPLIIGTSVEGSGGGIVTPPPASDIPEPTSLALMLLGLIGLGAAARKRRGS